MMNFDEIIWHDTTISCIYLDRTTPGLRDILKIECKNEINGRFTALFSGIWKVTCDLNFGIVAPETIRFARTIDSDPRMDFIRGQWKNVGVHIDKLIALEIETNSTASKIFVIFEHLQITRVGP